MTCLHAVFVHNSINSESEFDANLSIFMNTINLNLKTQRFWQAWFAAVFYLPTKMAEIHILAFRPWIKLCIQLGCLSSFTVMNCPQLHEVTRQKKKKEEFGNISSSQLTELSFKFTLYLHTHTLYWKYLILPHPGSAPHSWCPFTANNTDWNMNISFLHSWTSLTAEARLFFYSVMLSAVWPMTVTAAVAHIFIFLFIKC